MSKAHKFKRKITIMDVNEKISLILAIICTFISVLSLLLSVFSDTVETDNADISIKIENISNNLAEASSELSNIQKELEARIKYVENLKKEAEIAENLISMTDEQVNAVQAKINQELNASSGKSFFQSISISAFFFVLGLIIQPILKGIKKRFGKKSSNDTSISYDNKYTDDEIAQAIMLLDTIKQKEDSIKD
ncbi:MAG: hypothetical protein HDQ96_04585 [Lachnospiraceae bacterium]|nr:hypothetical protein [Lachnospiraceae bacterium]